jgi:hypothetical protein
MLIYPLGHVTTQYSLNTIKLILEHSIHYPFHNALYDGQLLIQLFVSISKAKFGGHLGKQYPNEVAN